MNFFDKLDKAIAQPGSLLFVGLDPNPEMLPERYGRTASIAALRDWMRTLVEQTAACVCAFKPTLGFYQALGPAGIDLLLEVLGWIPPHLPVILDAKHGDLNTGTQLARTFFEDWEVDAVTINPFAGQDAVAPFLLYPRKGVFVLCHTANPAAQAMQAHPGQQPPLYQQVVREARGWGLPEQLGLEVGTVRPEILARVRAAAPERLIMVRSLWAAPPGALASMLAAGLDAAGAGLLVPVPQECLGAENPGLSVEALRCEIEATRTVPGDVPSSCTLWQPDVCLIETDRLLDLALQLFDTGCILFGEYVQASGAVFPYYIDLRRIISNPQLFQQVLLAYAEILSTLHFDRIAGIPYGSLPTATGLALHLNRPLIFPRKEVKAHGTRRAIEGTFYTGETVVVVDDILITGNSAVEGARKLQSAGLVVRDIVVLIEHGPEASAFLQSQGYNAHAVLPFERIARTLHQAGRIDDSQYAALGEDTLASAS
ncbi:MAG: bifunctional orotidine-5'-phosphate decarboxylase/orotate phosphoribosyltransferase [Aphanocapsa lilacina HA4352-LM1]|jgi:uridine monophosphate synthetase|nr:bifunctional orotidine-5'-phosphate decarboxylase/orotate phosphoribosyltransferase [Aphanocapsa lilacina HA4352-LM1]